MSSSTSPRKRLALMFLGCIAALAIAAPAASASRTPYATVMYSAPTYYSRYVGITLSGSYVVMNCWTDSSAWAYGSNRWFHVGGVGFSPYTGRISSLSGFVPANRVFDQIGVRHC